MNRTRFEWKSVRETYGRRAIRHANGKMVSGIETDPYGADTSRSFSQAFPPKEFTSYDRDANGSDEAMFRRYNRWHSRFDQPDPCYCLFAIIMPGSFGNTLSL